MFLIYGERMIEFVFPKHVHVLHSEYKNESLKISAVYGDKKTFNMAFNIIYIYI